MPEINIIEKSVVQQAREILLLKTDTGRTQEWIEGLRQAIPDLEVRIWPNIGIGSEIKYALLWDPPEDLYNELSEVEVIFSMGAGIDHLLCNPIFLRNRHVVRMIEPNLTSGMVEYVLYHVLRVHRQMDTYRLQAECHEWAVLPQTLACNHSIGVMGLGVLGSAVARTLSYLGYSVRGWSRSNKSIAGVASYSGVENLHKFLSAVGILIVLLPLNRNTHAIVDSELLDQLLEGAYIINVGRGSLVVENDLLAAIGSGQVSGAALDVFDVEPLPRTHPYWSEPRITITPHMASLTNPVSGSAAVAKNIRCYRKGCRMDGVVDMGDYLTFKES
tara:strand:+ start:845 stop:1837 length:993 start_codon:yes stop_codon:yes gene_type:complete